MLKSELFIADFFRELNPTLMSFILVNKTPEMNPNLKGKHLFKFLNPNANEDFSEMFYQLLIECIYFWNSKLASINQKFTKNYEEAKAKMCKKNVLPASYS